jgi:hypothetical protein
MAQDIMRKFGPAVALAVDSAGEPRYDDLQRERPWKACRLEHLARLATAGPAAIDVCVADEMHRIGAALVAIRRLGVEYVDPAGIPNPQDARWWLRTFGDTLRAHPTWRREQMLLEFERLVVELTRRLNDPDRQ